MRLFLTIISLISLIACEQTNSNIKDTKMIPVLTKNQKMDTSSFWKIIDYGFERGNFNNKTKAQAILEQLTKLTPEQIQEFEIIFQAMNKKATTQGVYAAQILIEQGSSDDRFYYFRCWLISLGEYNFNQTIKNADHLATLDIPINEQYGEYYCQFEELIPMADNAYEIVTKKDPLTDYTFPRPNAEKLGLFYDSSALIYMTDPDWSDDEIRKRLPKLYSKYSVK